MLGFLALDEIMLDLVVTLEVVDTVVFRESVDNVAVELGLSLEDRVLMLCATL